MLKLQREREGERAILLSDTNAKKGGQVVVGLPSERLPKGGQRYSLIGGDSYGC